MFNEAHEWGMPARCSHAVAKTVRWCRLSVVGFDNVAMCVCVRVRARAHSCVTCVRRYVNLKILDLSGNKLSSVQHLDKCRRLRSLDLSRNSLRIFPLRLMDNKQLTHLNLSGNFISKIPRNVTLLAALVSLELSGNRLHNLPDIKHLKPLKHLRHLWIKGNMYVRSFVRATTTTTTTMVVC